MSDDPYPQTLPQQLRELGERWDVGRLRRLYATPIGRFVFCWMALAILLQIGAEVSNYATPWGWGSGASYEFWLPSLVHSFRYATAQVGAIALVIWFQCRWPEQNRWEVFVGFALGYALFLSAARLLVSRRSIDMDWAQLWPILLLLFDIVLLLFFMRTGNVIVRLFLVDRIKSEDAESAPRQLPTQNSWSLRGMFLVVALVACFLAILRPTKELWAPTELYGANKFLMAYWWASFFLELLILWMLAYAVAARRIRERRWIWWAALVVAVAIPRLAAWMVWYFTLPSGTGRPSLHFAPLWIDMLGIAFTMALLEWFYVACERSGRKLAMWIRGCDDAIPTA